MGRFVNEELARLDDGSFPLFMIGLFSFIVVLFNIQSVGEIINQCLSLPGRILEGFKKSLEETEKDYILNEKMLDEEIRKL